MHPDERVLGKAGHGQQSSLSRSPAGAASLTAICSPSQQLPLLSSPPTPSRPRAGRALSRSGHQPWPPKDRVHPCGSNSL